MDREIWQYNKTLSRQQFYLVTHILIEIQTLGQNFRYDHHIWFPGILPSLLSIIRPYPISSTHPLRYHRLSPLQVPFLPLSGIPIAHLASPPSPLSRIIFLPLSWILPFPSQVSPIARYPPLTLFGNYCHHSVSFSRSSPVPSPRLCPVSPSRPPPALSSRLSQGSSHHSSPWSSHCSSPWSSPCLSPCSAPLQVLFSPLWGILSSPLPVGIPRSSLISFPVLFDSRPNQYDYT